MTDYIEQDEYEKIARQIPIICVDIVIRDRTGRYLIIKRENPPLKGQWWVPGGRIRKQETILYACMRVARAELDCQLTGIRPIGFYEDIFTGEESPYDFPFHTMSFVFEAKKLSGDVKLNGQSSAWTWSEALPDRFDFTRFEVR